MPLWREHPLVVRLSGQDRARGDITSAPMERASSYILLIIDHLTVYTRLRMSESIVELRFLIFSQRTIMRLTTWYFVQGYGSNVLAVNNLKCTACLSGSS